jgi:uncharacterized iron-regulated membrane protein
MKRIPSFRTILFWAHLAAGLTAGVVILIMSATGVALTYQRQLQAWADRGAWTPPAGASRLALDDLAARVQAVTGSEPAAITVRSSPAELASVSLRGRPGTLLVDPYTGALVEPGPRAARMRAFFRWNTEWHRWLGQTGEGRARGKAITGASNLLFLFLVLSGLYLWLPRAWSWRGVRAVIWFRRGLAGRARNFNWHNTAGVWAAIPLAVIVASGTVISYPWASALVYRVMGEVPPAPAPRRSGDVDTPPVPGISTRVSLDAAAATAAQHAPGWRSLTLRLPAEGAAPLTISVDNGDGGQPQKRATLTLDAATGAVLSWEPFGSLSPGRRARSIMRFAHTGEVGGLAGQTIAGLASAAGVLLVWTGFMLAFNRFAAWRARRSRAVDQSADRRAA